jgi:TRAP-type C4-dicarboxylate transport system permease small subunit
MAERRAFGRAASLLGVEQVRSGLGMGHVSEISAPQPAVLDRLITAVALLGGGFSLATALMVSASVLGRWLFSAPIQGDFEMVEMATAIAVFSFLPYAQLRRANIMVDTFTTWLPHRAQRALDALWDVVYAVVFAILTYALFLGTRDFIASGETTMMRQIILWPAIATCAALGALTSLSALASAARLMRTSP